MRRSLHTLLGPLGSNVRATIATREQVNSSRFFLFLQLLRCFSSLGALPSAMYSPPGLRVQPRRGYPIRTSPDQSLLGSSPRLIAACYVLHRRSKSRHPPPA